MQDCSFHSFSKGCIVATLSLYRGEIRLLSRDEVVEERRQLTRLINGDAFFPLKSWPKETRLIFWEKNQWLIPKRSSWFSFSSVTVVSVVQYTQTESNGLAWQSVSIPLVKCISLRGLKLFS